MTTLRTEILRANMLEERLAESKDYADTMNAKLCEAYRARDKAVATLERIAAVRLVPGDVVKYERLTASGQAVVDMRNWARVAVGLPTQEWREVIADTRDKPADSVLQADTPNEDDSQ